MAGLDPAIFAAGSDPRAAPTAVRFSERGCDTKLSDNHKYPLAGLAPAIHVFVAHENSRCKTWMRGSSPRKGPALDLCIQSGGQKSEPDSRGSRPGMTSQG
jgi:hypothetical protein